MAFSDHPWGPYKLHLYLVGQHMIAFLQAIIEHFSYIAVTAEKITPSRCFVKELGHFEAKF